MQCISYPDLHGLTFAENLSAVFRCRHRGRRAERRNFEVFRTDDRGAFVYDATARTRRKATIKTSEQQTVAKVKCLLQQWQPAHRLPVMMSLCIYEFPHTTQVELRAAFTCHKLRQDPRKHKIMNYDV